MTPGFPTKIPLSLNFPVGVTELLLSVNKVNSGPKHESDLIL